MNIRPAIVIALLIFLFFLTGLADEQTSAIHVKKDDVAGDLVISISNPVIIDGKATQGVFAAGTTLTITGTVTGDVAVIGGNLILKENGLINGNVILVGSAQDISPSARIEGKLFTTPFMEKEIRKIFNDPASFLFSYEYDFMFIAKRIFSSLLLFILSIIILKLFPAHVSFASSRLKRDLGYTLSMGIVGITGILVLLLISLALCMFLIGIPIFLLLLLFLLSAWLFGIAVIFLLVGESILRWTRVKNKSTILALMAAIVIWTGIKFLPGISLLVHILTVILSVGITLTTRFGTGTPWFKRRALPSTAIQEQ